MKSIGVQELRENASKYLHEVQRGESFQITQRGRPVALLRPVANRDRLEELEAQGRVRPGNGKSVLDIKPVKLKKGQRPLSEILLRMRNEERF